MERRERQDKGERRKGGRDKWERREKEGRIKKGERDQRTQR